MQISTVLIVTSDNTFLGLLRQQIRELAGSRVRMIVAGTMNEASALLETNRPQVIIVHWIGDKARYVHLDRLLWTTSVLARRTPVLVIAERYRIDQATMMYRMGVSDYISRTHHLEQLARIMDSYLHSSTMAIAKATGRLADGADQPEKTWAPGHVGAPMTAQVG
jgi:DNA-binding NtrC family response regulator